MPYCRRCGAKLDDDAKYCYRCGASVVMQPPTEAPAQPAPAPFRSEPAPLRRNPFFIPIIIIIVVAVSALIIAIVLSAPLVPVDFEDSSQINQPNVNRLNLDFHADIGEINVFTNLTDKTVVMDVSASGSTNVFRSNEPKFTVENSTVADGEMVTARLTTDSTPFAGNMKVVCNIYVNPTLDLILIVRSDVGEVKMNADAQAKIGSLRLETAVGNTWLNVNKDAVVNGDIVLKTATGTVWFKMDHAHVNGNLTFDLGSGTGSVNMNVNQLGQLNGNVQVNAHTGTGDVNLNRLLIDGEVGARIESDAGIGKVTTDLRNFSGYQSPISSNNYPSESNINFNLNAGIGNIHVVAAYSTSAVPTLRN